MNLEELKKDTIKAYDAHVIDCMNESGILKTEEYIDSFIEWVDFNLRYYGEGLEELQELFETDDIMKITEQIKNILYEYENITIQK